MKIWLCFDFPGIDADSPQADDIIEAHFDRFDLRYACDMTGAASVTLEDVYNEIEEGQS